MKQIDVKQRGIGVTYIDGMADIRLWAPKLNEVSIQFPETGRTIAMESKGYGYWQARAKVANDEQYCFIVDDKKIPDPASLYQPDGVHGASMVFDVNACEWTDGTWRNIPLNDYIFYELHTGTFTSEGTFEAIEQKLDYLKELGITAVEIMPVAQFPGTRNWGYDGVFPFAVQNSYGGPAALQKLVDKCHEKGLAVVLDVVYNHLGPEGNYLDTFGYYFTDKYKTPWGAAINYDDAWCDGVRTYFIENALTWLRDFHIDALRLDAVHAIKDFSPKHILQELREHVDELMHVTGRRHYLIVECDLNDTRFIDSTTKGGYGMDAQWSDEFHHALRVTAGQSKQGYYEDFDGIDHLAKAYTDTYVYDGIYSPHRLKTFGSKVTDHPGAQFVVFSQNHDQVGNRMLGERTSSLVSFEMLKLLAGAVIVSPYLPLLFMGEEWGASSPFQYFISHTDPELVEAVRKGRKAEFASFHIEGEVPDPQAEDTYNNCKLQWAQTAEAPYKALLQFYTNLLRLRKSEPALHELDRKKTLVEVHAAQNVLTVHRGHAERPLTCYMNFSKQEQELGVNVGIGLEKIFDSTGTGTEENVTTNTSIKLQPESIQIYLNKNV
ncbi:MAG: malto-oligosyltrehalose trehalohydrolase [Bacteroidetes bacterium]|nr:malto-oligosyltrehalose trehalohydrolase [Bacteroidota bacterium]